MCPLGPLVAGAVTVVVHRDGDAIHLEAAGETVHEPNLKPLVDLLPVRGGDAEPLFAAQALGDYSAHGFPFGSASLSSVCLNIWREAWWYTTMPSGAIHPFDLEIFDIKLTTAGTGGLHEEGRTQLAGNLCRILE